MNNIIRVEGAKLHLAKNYIGGNKSLGQCLDEVPTVNAIEVPENPTNGDVIKAIFPYIEIKDNCDMYYSVNIENLSTDKELNTVGFRKDWWNALYKKE